MPIVLPGMELHGVADVIPCRRTIAVTAFVGVNNSSFVIVIGPRVYQRLNTTGYSTFAILGSSATSRMSITVMRGVALCIIGGLRSIIQVAVSWGGRVIDITILWLSGCVVAGDITHQWIGGFWFGPTWKET